VSNITKALIAQVKGAYEDEQPLKIVGGNSKAFIGRQTQGEALNLSGHRGILQYEPVELVLTALAGTPLIEIQQILAEQRQMLAFEPALFAGSAAAIQGSDSGQVSASRATLGGTLAANLSGPARPWSGSIRDMVLGVKLINGRGELLKFGGQVMKNVAGYDLARTQAGALGSLGVMTEISLKVMPISELTKYLTLDLDQGAAITLMNQLSGTAKPISGACWVQQTLHLRLSGAASSVMQSTAQWVDEFGFSEQLEESQFWEQLAQFSLPMLQSKEPIWRFSINPTAAPLALDKESSSGCIIDWAGAQRWVVGEQNSTQMQRLAEQAGGTVSLWRGGDRSSDVNHPLSVPMQQLQQRLKHSFDPKGILNPGRLYSWM
jgi:glycolate oxidase FAD binding subunit